MEYITSLEWFQKSEAAPGGSDSAIRRDNTGEAIAADHLRIELCHLLRHCG